MTTPSDATPPGTATARVVVYSRAGCHLCDQAEAIVAEVCDAADIAWHRIDIDTDPDLVRRFTEQVPVTFVDGAQHDFWRVDPTRLRTALGVR
ncbi:glutaredoxin family protein [Aeromicrobium sp. CF3.5]|uniref:glutaredoxin family protein n=1 Tax=Aeromicrobium sp. CF3.5 TaxID=3373078 RepID=UPI003EE6DC86